MNEITKPIPITIRIPADVYAQLVEQANKESRSLNAQIVRVLSEAVAGQSELERRIAELERRIAAFAHGD
jgi:hypothetical protein